MPFGISLTPEAYHQQIIEIFQVISNVDRSMNDTMFGVILTQLISTA